MGICFTTTGQNLVPNPSFELTTPYCGIPLPSTFNSNIIDWDTPTEGTPNIYHESLNISCPNVAEGSTSSSSWGSEDPRTDSSMAAIITYCDNSCPPTTREYLQVQLTSPLNIGQKYFVEMWVSLADNSGYVTDGLGIYFSVNPPSANNWLNLPYNPQISESNTITTTNGWVQISDTLIAASAFQYLTIGNFHDDQNTAFNSTGPSMNDYAVYFIDDVKVHPLNNDEDEESTGEEIVVSLDMPNVITPNNDGMNDLFVPVSIQGIVSMETIIFNRWGNEVFRTNSLSVEWGGGDVSDGTYFWMVNYTGINEERGSFHGFVSVFNE